MLLPLSLQTFSIGDTQLEIYVPDAETVRSAYTNNKYAAYWSQVWPASIGLCCFVQEHPRYVAGKNMLELAAGLGLPGLYAARWAKQVTITDKAKQAVECIQRSAAHLPLLNVTAAAMDWKDAMQASLPDVVLLSDVNYEPAVFEELQQVLEYFLRNKIPVIISTPQRLVAKGFIISLLPHCSMQWHTNVVLNGKETGVSVFVLDAR